jgi:hypothetical protein
MALTTEQREQIREEEWVRLTARQDFQNQFPNPSPNANHFVGLASMFVLILGVMGVMFLFTRLFGGN